MRGRLFRATGLLLILASAFLGYIEVGAAMSGSSEAWMAISALICAGVLGVGMIRVGSGENGDSNA